MDALRPYLRLFARSWRRLGVGAVLLFATTAAAVGLLALSGWFITATALAASAAGAVAAFDIYVPGAGIRFFALGRTISRYFERVHNHDMVLRLLAFLRRDVYRTLSRLDAATLRRFRSAELLNRLTADVDALDELLLRGLLPPVMALLAVLALTAGLALFSPLLGVVAGGVLLAGTLVVALLAWRRARGCARSEVEARATLRVRVLDLVQGLAEFTAFRALTDQRAQVRESDAALNEQQRRVDRIAAAGEALIEWTVHASVVAVLVLGLWLSVSGSMGGAVAVLAAFALFGVAELLVGLPGAFARIGRSELAATRLNELTGIRSAVPEPPTDRVPNPGDGLRLEAVRFRHDISQSWILDGVTLDVGPGESVAVTGRSGAGKSTLGALAARLADPVSGRIVYGGVDLRDIGAVRLRRHVAMLTQHTELFDDTIRWNLAIAAPDADPDAIWGALDMVDLADFVAELPDGLDTRVGESGVRLSGGQGRRLALARVVLANPDVVILDEPLRGVDAATARRISAALRGWLSARSALLLGHDATDLPPSDRVFRIEGGRLTRMPVRRSMEDSATPSD